MALAEKALADALIEWRNEQHLGTGYVPIGDAITVAADALEALQTSRATIAQLTAPETGTDT